MRAMLCLGCVFVVGAASVGVAQEVKPAVPDVGRDAPGRGDRILRRLAPLLRGDARPRVLAPLTRQVDARPCSVPLHGGRAPAHADAVMVVPVPEGWSMPEAVAPAPACEGR